jgi:hypothetical protein
MASISVIIAKAKEIQQPDESWTDALRRAIEILKNTQKA